MRVLAKFPTRGRPERFLRTLDMYRTMALHPVRYIVACDTDDPDMNNDSMRAEMEKRSVEFHFAAHKTKMEAVNACIPRDDSWDVLLLISDDMEPQEIGWDNIIANDMEKHFPDTNGVLHYNDGYTEARLNSLVIMGRKYYERFGYIYHEDYRSLWCDNEFMEVSRRLGRAVYIPRVIIKHEHWANNPWIKQDAMYKRGEANYRRDEETFRRRQATSFGL